MRKLIGGLVLGLAVLAGCGSSPTAGEPAPSPETTTSTQNVREKLDAEKDAAVESCKSAVEGQLKAPATAEYTDVEATLNGVDTYTIFGAVDSENGFGALVRSSFSCTATLSPSTGDTWESTAQVF